MPVYAEFYVVCDECGLFLGEDRGESDDLFSDLDEAVSYARRAGWDTEPEHALCTGCREGGPTVEPEPAPVQRRPMVVDLLADWVRAEASAIYNSSSNMTDDIRNLIEQAMARAVELDVEWDDDLIDDQMWEIASEYADQRWQPDRAIRADR